MNGSPKKNTGSAILFLFLLSFIFYLGFTFISLKNRTIHNPINVENKLIRSEDVCFCCSSFIQ